MSPIDRASSLILATLLADFRLRQLPATALAHGYEGVSLAALREACSAFSEVDFDLAMASLEEAAVETGPRAPWENDPHSSVFVFGSWSTREYAYLTEAGYRRALKQDSGGSTPAPTVQISGNTFYQSPVAIGQVANQSVTIETTDQEVLATLVALLRKEALDTDDQQLQALVGHAREGELRQTRTLFKKVFGLATEGTRQVAWNVISALIALQLGAH
jgi:hypothetical protein